MKKRLVAWLLFVVLVIGMLPTAVFADMLPSGDSADVTLSTTAEATTADTGGEEVERTASSVSSGSSGISLMSTDSAVNEVIPGVLPLADGGQGSGGDGDSSSTSANQKDGYWNHGVFLRMTITRFSGTNVSGLYDATSYSDPSAAQSAFNSALSTAAKAGSTQDVIIDIVNDTVWNSLGAGMHMTESTVVDYVYGNGGTGQPASVSGGDSGGFRRLSANHFIVSQSYIGRYISEAANNPRVGNNSASAGNMDDNAVFAFVQGPTWTNDTSRKTLYRDFVNGMYSDDESFYETFLRIADNDYNDSLFVWMDKFLSTNCPSFYSVIQTDSQSNGSAGQAENDFVRAFFSPGVNDSKFYLWSFELGQTKRWHTQSGGFSGPVYFYTTRDSVSRTISSGRDYSYKVPSPYFNNVYLTAGQTPAVLDDGRASTSGFGLSALANDVAVGWDYKASSYPYSMGYGLWVLSGYQGTSPQTTTIRILKSLHSNLPESYVQAIAGGSLESLSFPVTIQFSNLPSSQTVVNLYDSAEAAAEGASPVLSAPASGGTATIETTMTNEQVYHLAYGSGADVIARGGISNGVTITVTEDISAYMDAGMVGVIYEGSSSPANYRDGTYDDTMYAAGPYVDVADADTSSTDGYDLSGKPDGSSPGIASYTAQIDGSTVISIENWWIGYSARKELNGYDKVEPSEYLAEYSEQFRERMSAEAQAYYDEDFYRLSSYFHGYIPSGITYTWAPGWTNSNWASVGVTPYCAYYAFDESGSLVGRFTQSDLGLSDTGAYCAIYVKPNCDVLVTDPAVSFHTAVTSWVGGYNGFSILEPYTTSMHLTAEYGGTDENGDGYFSFHTVGTMQDGTASDEVSGLLDVSIQDKLNELMGQTPSFSDVLAEITANYPNALDDMANPESNREWGVDVRSVYQGDMYYKATITNDFTPTNLGGDCHLVIDMNLDKQPIYAAETNGTFTSVNVASHTIDCGGFGDGDTVDLTTFPLQPITWSVTGTDGKKYNVTSTPKGIFDAADGGTKLSSFTFTHTEPDAEGDGYNDLHVLWVQWDHKVDISTDGDDDGGGSGELSSSGWHTVYWDYGYTGGAVTSTQIGVTTHYATSGIHGTWSGLTSGPLDAVEIDYEPYIIHYELDVPAIPERIGWTFLGWVDMGLGDDTPSGNNYPNANPEWDKLYKNNQNSMSVLAGEYHLFDSGQKFDWGDRADKLITDYEDLAQLIEEVARNNGQGADQIEGTTFRAFWATQPIVWHSMGGTFLDRANSSGHEAKRAACIYSGGQYWEAGVTNPNPDSCSDGGHDHSHYTDNWSGDHSAGQLSPEYLDNCETYVRNSWQSGENEYVPIVVQPVRTGYTFMGWYFDPYCSVPITEFEFGIQPGRHYYAGWEAEDVIINYYDTREGTQLLGTQTVSYGDPVDLYDMVWGTSGWTPVGWTVTPETGPDAASEILDGVNEEWRADPGLAYGVNETAYTGTKFLETCDATYVPPTGSGFEEPDHGTGSNENEGYWVVNLYADYEIETTSYTVTIHWDDFANNDGCRPQRLHIGLITSVGNTICADAWVTGASDADTWTYTFPDLPITVSDSNTDIINYTFCLLGYVDANGNEGEIKDTQSGNGEIVVTTPTDHSTDATSSYRYDIGWYQTDGSDHFFDTPNNRPLALTANEGEGVFGSTDQSVVYTPYAGTLYMTHDLILTGDDIIFTIEWDDDSNRDGVRPEYVMLQLYASDGNGNFTLITTGDDTLAGNSQNGTVAVTEAMCQVSEDGNTWVYVFEDYQKYTNQGQLVVYGFAVNESYLTPGYSVMYMDNTPNGPDTNGVTLSYGVTTSDVVYSVNWHDNQNQDGLRPDKVVVELIAYQWNEADGKYESMTVGTQEVTGRPTNEVWQGVFRDMYVYHDGMPVTYRLKVISDLNGNIDDESNGYTWSEGVVGNQYINPVRPSVDIYHNADERSVTATVQWDDNSNNDHSRPDSVILQLYADNEPVAGEDYRVVLTGGSTDLTWTHTFEHLDVYRYDGTGDEVVYTIGVEAIGGGDLADYESWYLTADGEVTNARSASTEPFMMLEYVPVTDTVSGAIYWQDESNRDGERPSFVDVALMARVYNKNTNQYIEYIAETQTISLATDPRNTATADVWYFLFEDMPVYRDTEPVTYYLAVTSDLNGNITETAKNYSWEEKNRGDMDSTDDLEVSVNIYQRTEVRNVTATVEWNDDQNNDGIRPSSIVLQLYADGVRVEGEQYTVVLSGNMTADQWTYEFENLPRYRDGESGQEIVYTVYAAEVEEDSLYGHMEDRAITGEAYDYIRYTATYVTSTPDLYTEDFEASAEPFVRLTHETNMMDVPVSVIWQDENNRDGQRPEYVTLFLTAYQWNATLAAWEYKEVGSITIRADEELNTMTASEWT